jgi:hypothetical protein
MRILVYIACLVLIASFALAQEPTTLTQYDKTTGKVMGTTTIYGNQGYLRDRNGEHVATFIIDDEGNKRIVDPDGKPITMETIKKRLEQ